MIREHDHDQQGDGVVSGGFAQGSGGININALAMNEASIKKLHIGGRYNINSSRTCISVAA